MPSTYGLFYQRSKYVQVDYYSMWEELQVLPWKSGLVSVSLTNSFELFLIAARAFERQKSLWPAGNLNNTSHICLGWHKVCCFFIWKDETMCRIKATSFLSLKHCEPALSRTFRLVRKLLQSRGSKSTIVVNTFRSAQAKNSLIDSTKFFMSVWKQGKSRNVHIGPLMKESNTWWGKHVKQCGHEIFSSMTMSTTSCLISPLPFCSPCFRIPANLTELTSEACRVLAQAKAMVWHIQVDSAGQCMYPAEPWSTPAPPYPPLLHKKSCHLQRSHANVHQRLICVSQEV